MQVAVLSFGDFYDAQFVKLYTIFTAQLQVQRLSLLLSEIMHISTNNSVGRRSISEQIVFATCVFALFKSGVLLLQFSLRL